jgi:cell division control protein 6
LGIKIFEREAYVPSVFRDRSRVSIDYVPPYLPHREEEYKVLVHFFRAVLDNPRKASVRVLIKGRIGTGKTVLTRRFGADLENISQQKGINVHYVHVNCRESGSFFNLLKNVITKFEQSFPQRGFSSEEALRILMQVLDDKNAHLVLALDELEALIRREGSDPLYNLTRIQENRPSAPQRVSIICIFREPEYEDVMKQIDKSTLSTLQRNVVYLKEYAPNELRDILEYRVKEAFKEDAVHPETIGLIADIAGAFGDARYAIELLERSGVFADAEQSHKVLPNHVRKAKAELPPEIRKEYLRYTGLHEKLILLTIARYLEQKDSDYMSMGELEENYKVICEEYNEKPRAYTRFWKYVKELSDSGMISTKTSGEGFRGKTTLIGLLVPADSLRKEIEHLVEG